MLRRSPPPLPSASCPRRHTHRLATTADPPVLTASSCRVVLTQLPHRHSPPTHLLLTLLLLQAKDAKRAEAKAKKLEAKGFGAPSLTKK